MKKYLSLILAVMMVLSCVSYAAPVAVGTVSSADEAEVEVSDLCTAEVAEETEAAITTDLAVQKTIIHIGFENLTSIDTQKLDLSTVADKVYDIPWYFNASLKFKIHDSCKGNFKDHDDGSGKYLEITPSGSSYTRIYLLASPSYPDGEYKIEFDLKATKNDQSFTVNTVTDLANNVGWGSLNATTSFATYSKSATFISGQTHSGATALKNIEVYIGNSTDTWGIDNVKVIYRPFAVKVNFAGMGKLPAEIEVAKGGYFVPSEYAPASIPDTKEAFLGWSLTEGGEIVTAPFIVNADTTLYANYSDKTIETTGTYGKLAYFLDFDVAPGTTTAGNGFGKGEEYSKFTTFVAPKIAGMPEIVKMESYGANHKTDGDSLVFVNSKYPRIHLVAYSSDGNETSYPEGTYTVEYMARTNNTTSSGNAVSVRGINYECSKIGCTTIHDQTTANAGKPQMAWPEGVGEVAPYGGKLTTSFARYYMPITFNGKKAFYNDTKNIVSNVSKHAEMEPGGGMSRIGVYLANSTYPEAVREIKWVKIWYVPLNINLTLDANGKDIATETKTVSSTVKFADYKLADCGTSRFVGWSETKDGEVITDTTKVYSEDTTLYAVWDDFYYPEAEEPDEKYQLINISVNNFTGSNFQSQVYNYNPGIKYNYNGMSSSQIWDVLPGVPANTKWYLNVGPANNRYALYDSGASTNAFKHPDNAFRIPMTLEANKLVYPKMFISSANMPDGIYTIAAEVIFEKNDALTFAEVCMYAGGSGDPVVNVVDMMQNLGEKVYYTASMLILDGKAYDAKTFELSERSAVGANKFGLNFNLKASENTTVYAQVDNFRVYYQPYTSAPKSYSENSIRVAAPAGIRFRASVTSIERENEKLTEYGFIVTLDKLLKNASVDKNNFTHESNVTKVEGKSYDKANNVDKIFETQGNYSFFTAVVYNIPASQYKENIVVRPYVVIDGKYVYGDVMERNIYDVAQQIKEKNGADYATYKDAIDNILAEKAI